MLCKLASAHDAFKELKGNLTEGAKFYNDLTQVRIKYIFDGLSSIFSDDNCYLFLFNY